jgi:hypothetical protein
VKRLAFLLFLIYGLTFAFWRGISAQDGTFAAEALIESFSDPTIPSQGDQNGDAFGNRIDTPILYGRFASYLIGIDEDRQLQKADGTPILPSEVPDFYGTTDGMTIYADGLDVCSWDYAAREGFDRPLRPVFQDLSDAAGWPSIHVTPDNVAVDPTLGRFIFAAGDGDPLQVTGSIWTGFGVSGSGFIKVQGDYAVMPAGEGDFQVLNISDLANPTVVGHLRVDFNWVAAIYGDYTYISQGRSSNGLSVIDISDPTDPQWAGTNLWPHYAEAIEIRDDYAYITTSSEPAFHVLSLSDPLNPTEVGSANVGDPDGGRWVFLSGDRAYIGLATANGLLDSSILYGPRTAGFSIMDISDPELPGLLGTYLGEPEDAPQTSGLIAFYPYNGDAQDASGNEHHGTVYGPSLDTGYESGAFFFDGEDDYIRSPIVVDTSKQSQLTVGAWVNAASTVPYNAQRLIFSVDDGVQLPCLAQERRDSIPSERRGWSACGEDYLFAGGVDTAGEWIFLAAVYDLDSVDHSGTVTIYVQDQAYTGTVSTFAGERRDQVFVGSRLGTLPGPFHGLIDNVFIFADALEPSQITAIRVGGAGAILDLGGTLPVNHADPESLPPQKLPRLIGVSGDIALMAQTWIPDNYPLAQSAKFILVDATDPLTITRRGAYLFEADRQSEPRLDLYSAAANGDTVYITDDSQDSTGDSLTTWPWLTDDPTDYANYKGYSEDYTSLLTFDISDLDHPALVERYDHPQAGRFRHMTLAGDNLFVNDYNYGVRIFSLTDPAHPTLSGETTTAAEGRYSWVNDDGTKAFFTQTFGGAILSLDISNSSMPVKAGEYWDGEWSEKHGLTGRGDFLYVPTAASLNIIDVSDPSQPIRTGSFPDVYFQPALSTFADYAYVLTSDSPAQLVGGANSKRFLNIYDISDPSAPIWLNQANSIQFSTKQTGIYAQGRYAYVISPNLLTIVDVLDPAQPQVVGELSDPNLTIADAGVPVPIQVKDGYAYIITGEKNERFFHIVDVSDPANPSYLDTYTHSSSQHVTDIIVSGKYLYLGIYWGVFWIYDLTNPVAPVFVTSTAGLPFGGWGAAWSLGGLIGEHLAVPALSRFHLVDVPRDSQGLSGPITVSANLGPVPSPKDIFLPLIQR